MTRRIAFGLVAVLGLVRCVGDTGGSGKDAGPDVDLTGTEGHACFPNQTCDPGLTCISSVCVNLDSGSGEAGTDAGSTDADASSPVVGFQNAASASGSSPVTIASFDPGSNPNRLLVVGVSVAPNGLSAAMSVTFGSKVMQELTAAAGVASPNNNPAGYYACTSKLFYLVNPTGVGNVVVTFSGVASPEYAVAGAAAFYGVNQTTPVASGTQKSGSTTSMAINVATAPGHMTLANNCSYSNFSTTLGTERWLVKGNAEGAGSTIASTGTTNAHSWTQTSAYAWAASGLDVVPAP